MLNRISVDPEIQHGKPCIAGTRVPVYVILESLATGMSFGEIQEEYSPVTTDDIRAAVYYASLVTNQEEALLEAAGK